VSPTILIYGYGNPGRQDDGVGVAFAESLRHWAAAENLANLSFEVNYQLVPEDALTLAAVDIVIFADASGEEGIDAYAFSPLTPVDTIAFTTHAMTPESILALCEELYDKNPKAFLMRLRGYSWEPAATTTEKAGENVTAALAFIKPHLRSPHMLARIA